MSAATTSLPSSEFRAPAGVRIGVSAPTIGKGKVAGEIAATARKAEAMGFADLWIGEHILFPTPIRHAMVTAAVSVGATERIGIQFGLLQAALRHPVMLAKELTTLAAEADGRIAVGLGVGGDYQPEWDALQVPRRERGSRFAELLPPLVQMLRGEPVEHHGEHYDFTVPPLMPVPTQRIPVWIGALTKNAIERAALVDGWMSVYATPERFAKATATMRAAAAAAGRPAPEAGAMVFSSVTGTDAEARQRANRYMTKNYGISEEAATRSVVAGMSQLTDQVQGLAEAGATRIALAFAEPIDEAWPLVADRLLN